MMLLIEAPKISGYLPAVCGLFASSNANLEGIRGKIDLVEVVSQSDLICYSLPQSGVVMSDATSTLANDSITTPFFVSTTEDRTGEGVPARTTALSTSSKDVPMPDSTSENPPRQLSIYDTLPFEHIKHVDDNGQEYWLARELMITLDYTDWRNFKTVIAKAKTAILNGMNRPSDHVVETNKLITKGKTAQQTIDDIKLSRLACYLTAMNADSSKQAVSDAQLYFVVQTRKQEIEAEKKRIADKHSSAVSGYVQSGHSADWSETRVDSKESQKRLTSALVSAHETHDPDYIETGFAQNAGLFGMSRAEIVEYLGLNPSQAKTYRDRLGKYALEALRTSTMIIADKMKSIGRALTTDEQVEIILKVTKREAEHQRGSAEYVNVDYLSGAELDSDGKPLINRNVRLLK